MNELGLRIGANFKLTEEEADEILGEKDCRQTMARTLLKALVEGRFTIEGDTYLPEESIESYNKTNNSSYRIRELDCNLPGDLV